MNINNILTNYLKATIKVKCLVSVVMLLMAPVASAEYVSSDDVLNIGDYERFVLARQQSSVNVELGGELVSATLRDQASINISGGIVNWLSMFDHSSANISSASVSTIWAAGHSVLVLDGVSNLERLILGDSSHVNIIGSDIQFNGDYLTGYWSDGSHFNIRTYNRTGVMTNGLPGYITVNYFP
ncbi:MAG: hypothetical protein V3T17_06100 [Pseudomonadales bacterium]